MRYWGSSGGLLLREVRGFAPSGDTQRWACHTEAGCRAYPLPKRVGPIVSVIYKGREYPIELTLFEMPITRSYLMRVYSMNGPPASREEAFAMLRAAHGSFSFRPMWYRWEDELLIWPPAPNDGEIIVVEHLPEQGDQT